MRSYRIHLIRHGLTQANQEGVMTGNSDSPLCTDGIAELEAMKRERLYPSADLVYSSSLAQCTGTAEILYPETEIRLQPKLTECGLGVFEGKSAAELEGDETFSAWLANSLEVTPAGGEEPDDFLQRILEGLSGIFTDMIEQEVGEAAVITHGGVIAMLLATVAFPRLPFQKWLPGNGRGFTVLVSPQLWMRDRIVEAISTVPYERTAYSGE